MLLDGCDALQVSLAQFSLYGGAAPNRNVFVYHPELGSVLPITSSVAFTAQLCSRKTKKRLNSRLFLLYSGCKKKEKFNAKVGVKKFFADDNVYGFINLL